MEYINSKEGKVCVFDKNASGMVWGEGCGIIILKDLQSALNDGDHIYAVIKGSAVNNDGKTSELTSPNFKKQSEVITKAWKEANINPETISYIESNGTGTLVGDSIEFKAIKESFEQYTDKKQFCGIGSVKPSIGHSIAASGIASLQKVILAMVHKTLPPTIQFKEPNPLIDFSGSPCYINDCIRSWESSYEPRRAGVNSFSFTRTNCHIVVEEAPSVEVEEPKEQLYLFLLSAKNKESLLGYMKKYNEFLSCYNEPHVNIRDLCYTAAVGREHYEYRLAITVKDLEDLREKIQEAKNMYSDVSTNEYINYNLSVDNGLNKKEQMHHLNQVNLRGKEILKIHEEQGDLSQQLINELGKLYIQGMNINWKQYFVNEKCFRVSLPTYAFNKKHYWIEGQGTVKEENTKQENIIQERLSDDIRQSIEEIHIVGGVGEYSDTEIKLANIWGQILSQEEISIKESFKALGGNSIEEVKVQAAIEEEFDIDLDEMDIILDYSSIEAQALIVDEIVKNQSSI